MMCVVKEIQNRKAACDQDKSVIDNEIVVCVQVGVESNEKCIMHALCLFLIVSKDDKRTIFVYRLDYCWTNVLGEM